MTINIAHVFLTLNVGGMEKVSLDIIRQLDRTKYKHYIICLEEIGTFGESFDEAGIEVLLIKKKPGFDFSLIGRLRSFFKEKQISIVHSNNPAPHFWAGMAAASCGVPARLNTKHGRNFVWMKRRVLLNRFSAFFSHKVVCVSEDSARLTRDIEKVPAEKVRVIGNGVDTEYFVPAGKDQSPLVSELGCGSDEILIGSIARFSVDKDHDTLIKAFSKLLQKHGNARLVLIGDGETLADQKALCRSLGVEKNVEFLGARKDVLECLTSLDVYVLSSHTEGISISLLEAMSCKKVVLASDVGGCAEIIQDTENGFLIPESDVDAMATCLIDRVAQLGKEADLQTSARDTVIERYSLANTVRAYEDLYQELLGS